MYWLWGLIIGASGWFRPLHYRAIYKPAAQRKEIITNLVQQLSQGFNWQLDVERTAEELTASIEQNIGSPEEIVHLGGLLSKSLLSVLVCVVSSIYLIIDSRSVGNFVCALSLSKNTRQLKNYPHR